MSFLTVIIPTHNAEINIDKLLKSIRRQTVQPDDVIVIDSESDDDTVRLAQNHNGVTIRTIPRAKFDHGGTRDDILQQIDSEYAILLTQDVAICDNRLFEKLITSMREDESIALCYARQKPYSNANRVEKLIREFNYPEQSCIKDRSTIKNMGIKTYFCSNVCAAYRVKLYKELGGFLHPIRTNEDMFFAVTALNSGYKIAYVADATVIHSHDFSLKEQYRRNFAQGYEMEKHKELIKDCDVIGEGNRLAEYVIKRLLAEIRICSTIRFIADAMARLLGNTMGRKRYRCEKCKGDKH